MSGAPSQLEPEAPTPTPQRRRLPRQVRWTVSAFLLALVLEYLVIPQLEGASKSLYLLGKVNVAFLILGAGLEFASLLAYAQLTHTVLPGHRPSRWRLLRINTSTLAVTHVVPGGTAPGTGLAYRLLTEADVQGPDAAFGLAMQGVGSAVVLNLIFWVAMVVSIFLHGYNPYYGIAAGVGVLLMAAFASVVVLLLRGRHHALDLVRGFGNHVPFLNGDVLAASVERIAERLGSLLDNRPVLQRAIVWAAANWLLDAASLWVFLVAFHKVIGPDELLVAYGLANVMAVIPVTPGGLGIIEGVLIPTLVGFGATKNVATLGVFSWRLVNFWLPIPAGFGTYLSLRVSGEHGWRARLRAARRQGGLPTELRSPSPPSS
ncbi:MAG TPA: YbhN family protein [Acidimicrobiales bacterium]|nr:YbhN family protein [Acidimicrobiales bacterium]